jgi:hypothetical protein
MSWIIKGETGKTLDATARSLESLNISAATLRFQSLAADTLTWTAETSDATGAGTIVPDIGQVVELWWDTTRKFRGHVTAPKVGMRRISITVEGPWWWLDRINLTSEILPYTGASSGAAERASYVFATGSLKTHLEALIDRAIANGAPITRGTVAAMYDVPKMTLSESSCAAALATLLAWCPDAVAWFDYSGSLPAINIYRRDATEASATTFTIGTDPVETCDITPRLDLEVKQVDLNYVERNATTGRPAWAAQSAVSGTPAAGQRQIVTVSGPEIVDYLPKDDFDTVDLQTISTVTDAFVSSRDSYLSPLVEQYGSIPGGVNNYVQYWTGTDTSKTEHLVYYPGVNYQRKDGTLFTAGEIAAKHLVLGATVPDWVLKQYGGEEVTVSGTWTSFFATLDYSGSHVVPDVYYDLQGFYYTGFSNSETIGASRFYTGRWTALAWSLQAIVIDTAFAASTAVYKAWDYDYLHPPAGLAAALQAAQSWVPWEGPIVVVGDEVSGDNLLPRKYHLANCLAPCATMGALARGVSHDLTRKRTSIDLGAPARVDFGSLVGRVRREPQDNIVYL